MTKNYHLTPLEQDLMGALDGPEGIVDTADLADRLPAHAKQTINKLVSSLASKGYLHRLKRGNYLYQRIPSERPAPGNLFAITQALWGGYIGFLSALRLHDLTQYEPFIYYAVTEKRSGRLELGSYTLRAVAMGRRATGMTFHKGVYVSTVPKTFFDCFFKPQNAGGYHELTRALHDAARSMEWDEFLSYFRDASPSLCQRTGYVLDTLAQRVGGIPSKAIDDLQSRVRTKSRLVPTGPSSGRYVRQWKLLDNLGPKRMLGWWEHG